MKLGSIALKTIVFAAAVTFFGSAYASDAPQQHLIMGAIHKDDQGYALQAPTGKYQIEDMNVAAWQGKTVDLVGVPHDDIAPKTIDAAMIDPSLYAQDFNPGISLH